MLTQKHLLDFLECVKKIKSWDILEYMLIEYFLIVKDNETIFPCRYGVIAAMN